MTSEFTAIRIQYPHNYNIEGDSVMPKENNKQELDYDPDELIGTIEAAEILGVTPQYIGKLINREENRLPAQRIGKTWIIRRGDLEDFRDRPSPGRPKSE